MTEVTEVTEEVKAPRHVGVVKWFNARGTATGRGSGYGFIEPDGGDGRDAFVHIRDVEASGLTELREGDKVSYDLEKDFKSGKIKAVNIELIHQ